MARISRTYISWIWVAVVLIYATCTPAYGDVKEPRLTLVFRIINNGQVAHEVVNMAKVRVSRSTVPPVFKSSGRKGPISLLP